MDYKELLKELLNLTIQEQASDLHISVGHVPTLRIFNVLVPLIKLQKISAEDAKGLAFTLLNEKQQERFLREKDIDFSFSFENRARFRTNIFFQKGYVSTVFRLIPPKIPTIEELNLPSIIHEFARLKQGFILITGASRQGKSTTLAALLDEINHTRNDHIITIEDPIEYVFDDDRAIFDQREVYQDALDFPRALKASFRQDPDVIMVGEMRDSETISTAITAAETGHLVFATLHTNDAAQTIHRIIDSFPPGQQSQVRAQLSSSLAGVLSQRLIPRIRGGLIPACEIMFNNPAISNLIRENKTHEIPLIIATSAEAGMISLNQYLVLLIKKKEISLQDALKYSSSASELQSFLKGK